MCRFLPQLRFVSSIAVFALVWASAHPSWAEDYTRATLKVGLEQDSNARRTVGGEGKQDQLIRAFVKASMQRGLGVLGVVQMKLLLGAKSHQSVSDEDALVTSAGLAWSAGLWRFLEVGQLGLYARGEFGDRSERASLRDYMRGGATAGVRLSYGPVSLSGGGGWRAFVYKPDFSSNNRGPALESSLAVALGAGFSAQLSSLHMFRSFDADRFVEANRLIAEDVGVSREDALHSVQLGGRYDGEFLIDLSYSLQLNQSNSVGPGLVRHVVSASWAQPLPMDFIASISGRIQHTYYDDPVRVDETLQIDDEDKNQLVAGVVLPFMGGFGVELRYSLYTEALSDQSDFVRHLIYMGCVVDVDGLDWEGAE